MLKDHSPIAQALLGTLFTWALTAAGAALVVVIRGKQRKLLDVSLGFAAGVMLAASYWSLLAPAIEMATESKIYGAEGEYAFVPVAVGLLVGAAFVYGTDVLISTLGIQSPNVLLAMQSVGFYEQNSRRRQITNINRTPESAEIGTIYEDPNNEAKNNQWRRILLLVVAITVHNIPEGLAVGVGFGAVGSSSSATFENAR
ncbi:zinc transporter ZIP11-like isoform X2 [Ooceraea biroi]|nr:zinc transporter ZIP11-like isoform X2 [Ooceraea biroi]